VFGFRKARYREPTKNGDRAFVTALANILLDRNTLMGPVRPQ
jgi:hypothetical protein